MLRSWVDKCFRVIFSGYSVNSTVRPQTCRSCDTGHHTGETGSWCNHTAIWYKTFRYSLPWQCGFGVTWDHDSFWTGSWFWRPHSRFHWLLKCCFTAGKQCEVICMCVCPGSPALQCQYGPLDLEIFLWHLLLEVNRLPRTTLCVSLSSYQIFQLW